MLPLVKTPTQKLEKYRNLISERLFEEIKELSSQLKGLRINLINSTPRGGGVAEILKSLVPLMKGEDLHARWYTIPPREDFFEITKKMHNALQGQDYDFPFTARKRYIQHMERSARLMRDMGADMWVVHDPQPAGVITYLPRFHPSVCRLHIDLTSPNREVWDFVASFLEMYDKVVVTSKEFIKPEIKRKVVVIPPAIDPLALVNYPLGLVTAKQILKSFGIDPSQPLIAQVSRFDPWKDPLGVIRAYQIAKKKIPNLQLALVGFGVARDDPGAMRIYKTVRGEAVKDPNIFLFFDPDKLGSLKVDTFTNAIQVASDIILQKSIREGFALTVTGSMWKEKVVIGGKAGGIKLQIENGKNGFLVTRPEEAAKRIIEVLKDPKLAQKLGKAAKKTVQKNFLMPRLLRDYLKLFKELVFAPK